MIQTLSVSYWNLLTPKNLPTHTSIFRFFEHMLNLQVIKGGSSIYYLVTIQPPPNHALSSPCPLTPVPHLVTLLAFGFILYDFSLRTLRKEPPAAPSYQWQTRKELLKTSRYTSNPGNGVHYPALVSRIMAPKMS